MPDPNELIESPVDRLARLMRRQGVPYMTDEEAAQVDVLHDRRDARRPRQRESDFHYRAPPPPEPPKTGPQSLDYDPSYDAPEAEVLPGIRWGRTEAEDGPCYERHLGDAIKACPYLEGLQLTNLTEQDVTPYELAHALKGLLKQPHGAIRTTHIAYLFGIIRKRRLNAAFPNKGG